ncbi:alcohol dehydrogenase [Rhodotorula toruloides]|uniref:Alcohol dehydrogenase n=1 Tax=Rhodotorula toruloides TaxID=5286 RepID=A0A511K9L8_RHOTO|nr:alcohol dehydrogenase [Rhodotorula toruloides]
MSFLKTYKVAEIQTVGGQFVLVKRSLCEPKEGEGELRRLVLLNRLGANVACSPTLLVKVLASGVCHTDAAAIHGLIGAKHPLVSGHEVVGDVAAVGPSEKRWKVGDRVGADFHGGHCGVCKSCLSGSFDTCVSQNITGIFSDGGHAEYGYFRTVSLASVPVDMDPAEAVPLICAGVTVYNSLRNVANLHPGDIVALGAHLYIDASKENQAEALNKMGGAKVTAVTTAPDAASISSLIPALAVHGMLLLLAASGDPTVPTGPVIFRRTKIQGWPTGTPLDEEETLDFPQLSGIKSYIEKFPLDQIQTDRMMSNHAREYCFTRQAHQQTGAEKLDYVP